MGKRKPIPSINIGNNLNKKLKFSKQDSDQQQQQQQEQQPQQPQQPIIKYKSKREKEIHEKIDKIKSERKFIYKNAERHVKLSLEYAGLALSLPAVLKDLHRALEKFDALESSLIAELESLKIPVKNASTIPVLHPPINHVNTSIATTAAASINNNNNNDNTITTTTTTTTISNDNLASTTNSLPVNSVPRTTATLSDVNSLITATLGPTTAPTIGSSATTGDTTAIDGTNTNVTTDTTTIETTMKKKGRPPLFKEIPENCYVCGVTETPYWRRGTDEGVMVDLCNACGLRYMKLEKKERLLKQKNSTSNVLN
ncbi:hypothetical protein DDB_G0280639 [Dictyostelium discoideum AX4]|uniref:GATA zinc finger domain-containing protein 20 n=1 Tax=Dictyostelium discoideum TaxID=44689 RepID=GTAT_DICDI|nr:hypothetical protein DDB_G0280639 [Dictyostelium discoideum AX4]Q54V37.1 RecName: Full=GATA zinc finger domain-containing protein 20 [Dictyostelium discoideum]EAL67121.1 hypothetical protein DDB_G0280639 [Dictyostelium discoideum AX4]|eukprot:XP_641094.1 hypothetical protein DDB_G0280639 [Dictyostelium discoideum AX4]